MRKTPIGQEIIIKDHKHGDVLVGAYYADGMGRVRILTGEHSKEMLHRHEYDVVEKVEHDTCLSILGTVWMTV